MFDRFHPGYFGKRGMRYFHKTQQKFYCPTVNVEKLGSFVGEQKAEGEKIPVIDCVANGYYKVLGNGVWKTAAIVKAKFFSKLAEKKIVAAGGVCVPIA
jgi:large subunit ribosomal protein L27Ae